MAAPEKNEKGPSGQPEPAAPKAKFKPRDFNLLPTSNDAEDILRRVQSLSGSNMKTSADAAALKRELEWLENGQKAVGGPLQKLGDGKFLKIALQLAKLLLAQYLSDEQPTA